MWVRKVPDAERGPTAKTGRAAHSVGDRGRAARNPAGRAVWHGRPPGTRTRAACGRGFRAGWRSNRPVRITSTGAVYRVAGTWSAVPATAAKA